MKLFLISAAAVALALASPALAQDHQDKGHGKGDHNRGTQSAPQAAPAAKPVVPPHQRITPGNATTQSPAAVYQQAVRDATARNQRERQNNNRATNTYRPDTNRANVNRRDNNRPYNNARSSNQRDNSSNWNNNNRGNNGSNWNNNYRGNNSSNWNNNNRRDNRGSWQGRYNRRDVQAQRHYRYRGSAWRWPSGHSYRRWTFGMTLPSLFWGRNYWISDYSYYGLAYPPPGTVWVRYGSDAILIDRYTGEILEVVYGQFY
ncbi:MAG TPA: RcnB family protein [Rhizomicrobium sp.]